jgi:hypothetical protein
MGLWTAIPIDEDTARLSSAIATKPVRVSLCPFNVCRSRPLSRPHTVNVWFKDEKTARTVTPLVSSDRGGAIREGGFTGVWLEEVETVRRQPLFPVGH